MSEDDFEEHPDDDMRQYQDYPDEPDYFCRQDAIMREHEAINREI